MSDYGKSARHENFVAGEKYCDEVPHPCDCGKEKLDQIVGPGPGQRIVGGAPVQVSYYWSLLVM